MPETDDPRGAAVAPSPTSRTSPTTSTASSLAAAPVVVGTGARVGSLAAVGVCAVAGAAFVLAPGLLAVRPRAARRSPPGSGGDSANAPATPRTTSTVRPPPVGPARPTNALDRQIAAAVVSASPEDFFLDLHNGESSSGGVDGTADDGDGPGRHQRRTEHRDPAAPPVQRRASSSPAAPAPNGPSRAVPSCPSEVWSSRRRDRVPSRSC